MFCTKCGRELLKDGTPCVCGSGQAELILENTPAAGEWAEEVAPLFTPEDASAQPEEESAEEVLEEAQATIEEILHGAESEQPMWEEPTAEPQETPMPPMPVYPQAEYAYGVPPYAVPPIHPVRIALRDVLGSPLFLVAAILASVNFALHIANVFMPMDMNALVNTIVSALNTAFPGVGDSLLSEFGGNLVEVLQSASAFSFTSVLSWIVQALGVLALWLIYGSAKSKSGPKTGGFVILQILRVMGVVGSALYVLLAVVCGVLVFVYLQSLLDEFIRYGMLSGDLPQTIMVIAMAVVGVLFVYTLLELFYTIAALNTISRARKAVKTGIVMKKASRFVMVVCFISAAVTLTGAYTTLMLTGPVAAAMDLTKAATDVLFALLIIRYNKTVRPFLLK